MRYIEIGNLPELEYNVSEAMNTLATNLSFCGDDIHTVLLTSRYANEGKSFVTMNLMRTLASLQKSVVLLDADLRCSKLVGSYQMRFPEGRQWGLAHYLAGMCQMEDIVYETNVENACIVPIGRLVDSSLQLLSSSRLPQLMEALSQSFDVVLVDAPPSGVIVDALELAKYCDGALVVVSYNRGRRQDIKEVVDGLKKAGCPVLGAALNSVNFDTLVNRKYYYRSERYASYYNGSYNPYVNRKQKKGVLRMRQGLEQEMDQE